MSLLNPFDATTSTSLPASTMQSDVLDRQAFWEFADKAKEATEALAEQRMKALAHLPVEAMRKVCMQYRFFTIDYISDLALLLAKLPFGGLRSLLSQILSEELGEGDADKAHPEIYDRFLTSIGVDAGQLDHRLPRNEAILSGLTDELCLRGPAFGVGLRGMGGECLCQTYLSVMFEHLREHPYIRQHDGDIEWEFWTIHTGEQDIVHGELTRAAIDDYIRQEPEVLPELAQGYERSITAWNQFWQNIFEECAPRSGLTA